MPGVAAGSTLCSCKLSNRTTRSLSLTEIGKNYLDECRDIIGTLEEMESNLMHTTRDPSGKIRIAAPMTFVASELGALFASYHTLHPRIDFDVRTFDTHVNMVGMVAAYQQG
jgi:DNA-binding transcriptional LysR family regulator